MILFRKSDYYNTKYFLFSYNSGSNKAYGSFCAKKRLNGRISSSFASGFSTHVCIFHVLTNTVSKVSSITSAAWIIRNSRYHACVCPANVESAVPLLSLFYYLDFTSSETARREELAKHKLWIRESKMQTRRYFLCPYKRFSNVLSSISSFLKFSRKLRANLQNETNQRFDLFLHLPARHSHFQMNGNIHIFIVI